MLHDHVLHWLNHEKLEPRDILVVTPDLDTYAPCLETVFDAGVGDAGRDRGEAEERRQQVPCTIADRAVRRESGVSDAFLRMLELAGSRLGAAAVLDLLEAEPVRRKFGLSERDLERVASWVKQGGIRWGEDPRHRERLGLPGVPETTWRYGLDRWLLGYALPGLGGAARPVTLAGIGDGALVPCTDIEGEGAETLGRFVEFVERLFAGLRGLEAARPLAAWARDLTLLCEGCSTWRTIPERRVRCGMRSRRWEWPGWSRTRPGRWHWAPSGRPCGPGWKRAEVRRRFSAEG
ncbi:MAG: exodeoxyribonuclease V subunit gamma [Verrucomicrobia bacterium]|nr:exodeoxyribonuclease V subunit gamma [Verrucomicrobiota bacterium]